MVEELKAIMARASDGYSDPDDHYAAIFIRDHGHALVEAVKDAERYKYVRDSKGMKGFWICHGIFGEGASRWTGEHADRQIDLARTKDGAGGGV